MLDLYLNDPVVSKQSSATARRQLFTRELPKAWRAQLIGDVAAEEIEAEVARVANEKNKKGGEEARASARSV